MNSFSNVSKILKDYNEVSSYFFEVYHGMGPAFVKDIMKTCLSIGYKLGYEVARMALCTLAFFTTHMAMLSLLDQL